MKTILIVDNNSIYNKKLSSFFIDENINFVITPYNKIHALDLNTYTAFILTGRHNNNKYMNMINSQIIKFSINNHKHLLGICYGAEILALTLGNTIIKMNSHQKNLTEINIIKNNPLCQNNVTVFENHRYQISRLKYPLTCIAKSKTCSYEIIQYAENYIFGTQFHPEMNNDGRSILKSFVLL